jgi:hypothetical protein
MMKNLLLALSMIIIFHTVQGQRAITVQSGINAKSYTTIDSALAHAIDGDHIYIPGGVYQVNNMTIDKSVFIFGAGHYPDSTVATGATSLIGDVYLITGSSGGLLTGCSISGSIKVGNGLAGTDSVSNFTLSRNIFKSLYLSFTGSPPTHAHTFSVIENVIQGSVYGANASLINLSKNIVEKSIRNFSGNCLFENNDFIGLGNCTDMEYFLFDVSICTFDNNIFLYSTPACSTASFFGGTSLSNVFTNCLFRAPMTFPQGSNNGFNSIISQPVSSIFISATGDTFSYTQNYHLKPTSPGTNGATDGKDIGITGTSQPYKAGAVPLNPHIQMKSIDSSTNPQGQINIQVKVSAQDH